MKNRRNLLDKQPQPGSTHGRNLTNLEGEIASHENGSLMRCGPPDARRNSKDAARSLAHRVGMASRPLIIFIFMIIDKLQGFFRTQLGYGSEGAKMKVAGVAMGSGAGAGFSCRWALLRWLAIVEGVAPADGMTESRELIQAGRHGVAARKLAEVLAWEPDSDEAAYLLGICEKSLGRPDRRPRCGLGSRSGSRFGILAVLGRAALLVDGGRFADAERLIDQALREPRIDGFDLRRFLTPLLWHEGRLREARRLVETNWESLNRAGRGGSDQAIEAGAVAHCAEPWS